MNITMTSILNETEFILGIWAARLTVSRGIINNFKDPEIQSVIDFKGKRNTETFDDELYAAKVQTVWEKYCDRDFNSSYWHHQNLKFTSSFIVKAAVKFKKERLELKKKKIIELKNEVAKLEADVKYGKSD